jgi:hypothetical protein
LQQWECFFRFWIHVLTCFDIRYSVFVRYIQCIGMYSE